MIKLWVEKYRPKTVSDYVFRDSNQEKQVRQWIDEKSFPHLLLSGNAGIGKTSLAKMLLHEIEISDFDILEMNASRTNSVDDVRDRIVNFVQLIPWGDFKVVLLDEADYLSPNAQGALRGVMEEYHNFARFILTCNYPNKIIPAIHSRCHSFHLTKLDKTEFTARIATILLQEGITPDLDILDTYVKTTFPDLRKCINMVQSNIQDKSLLLPTESDSNTSDWQLEMVKLFKQGDLHAARKLVCSQIRPEEMEGLYRWLYDNIELFGDDSKQDSAIVIIKQGLVDHTLVSDPEINLAATLIKLARL